MTIKKIKDILILGGGSAGWMTAAALSRFLPSHQYNITLVESEDIGTVGVGEATIPHIRFFNDMLGIDEADFIRETKATYKLGIELSHWGQKGDAYFHPFGDFGEEIRGLSFHHFWLKQKLLGNDTSVEAFSLPIVAAKSNKFAHPHPDRKSLLSMYGYAFHLDASLYAKFLRRYSEAKGVTRKEGKVCDVEQNKDSGFIEKVSLQSGEQLKADFFIDCSGFRGVLIEQALKSGYEDWGQWFICDRAVAVPTESCGSLSPFTKAIASDFGWQWRIPLQHRMGNGYVYSSQHLNDEEATQSLLSQLESRCLADPKIIRFKPGRRKSSWKKNCVAIGLSAGFLEPLESTSLFLIQISIMKLLEFFPTQSFNPVVAEEFNRVVENEYLRVRDFLILHYHATNRDDTSFWNYVRQMPIPDSLQQNIELFREMGSIQHYQEGLFLEPSWVAVFLGQGIIPKRYNPMVDHVDNNELAQFLKNREKDIVTAVNTMPTHSKTIERVCKTKSLRQLNLASSSMSLYGRGN